MNAIVPRTSARSVAFPGLLHRAGKNAIFAAAEFFSASLSNPHTCRAYARPVENFLASRGRAAPGDAGPRRPLPPALSCSVQLEYTLA